MTSAIPGFFIFLMVSLGSLPSGTVCEVRQDELLLCKTPEKRIYVCDKTTQKCIDTEKTI
jgi:hypothetical protein